MTGAIEKFNVHFPGLNPLREPQLTDGCQDGRCLRIVSIFLRLFELVYELLSVFDRLPEDPVVPLSRPL